MKAAFNEQIGKFVIYQVLSVGKNHTHTHTHIHIHIRVKHDQKIIIMSLN